MGTLDGIMGCLSFKEGLAEAINSETEGNWLKKYFLENKSVLCFEGCHSLIVSEGDSEYYTLEINGNDYGKMSFIIQDDWQNDINIFEVDNYDNESEISNVFNKAFDKLKEYAL